jgi:hypothetical protein
MHQCDVRPRALTLVLRLRSLAASCRIGDKAAANNAGWSWHCATAAVDRTLLRTSAGGIIVGWI